MISRMRKRRVNRPRRSTSPTAVLFSLLATAEAVESQLEAAVSPLGLSLAKLGVLHPLAEASTPLSLSELAERQHCVRSNITQLVDRLEHDGLVRRRPDPDDRRGVLAALTPAGEQAYNRGMRALLQVQQDIARALSAADAASLKRALDTLTS
jgi:DNA-binding MarR family transcriptional regulator